MSAAAAFFTFIPPAHTTPTAQIPQPCEITGFGVEYETMAVSGTTAARALQALRKNRRGGRPPVLNRCPFCREKFSTTDFRKHKPRCPKAALLKELS